MEPPCREPLTEALLQECNAKLDHLIALQERPPPSLVRSFAYCAAICVAARVVQTWLLRVV